MLAIDSTVVVKVVEVVVVVVVEVIAVFGGQALGFGLFPFPIACVPVMPSRS